MGTKTNLKSIPPPPPPPPQNKQSPQFFSKEKGNKKLCFFKGVHGSGTKRSQKKCIKCLKSVQTPKFAKKYIGNHPVEEVKKMKCYKRLIHVYKQFVQVSGLCGPQFLSNWCLPKCFTQLCRALYGDAILVYRFGAPILWPWEINKNIRSSLFL